MGTHSLLQDLTILLLVSLPINTVFHKIKLPSAMGYLIAGMLIGPYGFSWIGDPESVEQLAEIGVVLLLFVIGLEFSLAQMLKNLVRVIGTGGFQIILTFLPIFLILESQDIPAKQGVLLALIVAFSSTAIVLKMVTDRGEIDTAHGRICIGALLFQDICVMPVMLVIPILAQAGQSNFLQLGWAVLQSMVAVFLIFFLARLAVPKALNEMAKMGSKEQLILFVILIILATGWISEKLGLSLAMGAFIAGLIISESEYHYQIILDILPLRDYFVSIFFISIGMLLNIGLFMDSIVWYLELTAGVMLIKAIGGTLAAWIFKNPIRSSLIFGLWLAQVGEFSFLLAGMALEKGLFPESLFQSFLIVSILSMLATPLLIQYSSSFCTALVSRLAPYSEEPEDHANEKESLEGHVIVAGYGLGGHHLSQVLKETNIPFIVVDLDGERIKQALAEGVNALFGDASHRAILRRAGIQKARMIVFVLADYSMTSQGIKAARNLNPEVFIMVRTHYAAQVEELNAAGASQVIPEEFETSIEIFSRVLREYNIPNNVIEQQIELVRLEGYAMFRGVSLSMESLGKFSTYLTASLTKSFPLLDNSWAREKTVEEIGLKEKTGVTLIAVVRNNNVKAHPDPDFRFQVGDILILFGSHAQVDQGLRLLQSGV